MDRQRLFRVLNFYKISYDPVWSLPCIRSYVQDLNQSLLESTRRTDISDTWPQELKVNCKNGLIDAFKNVTSSARLKEDLSVLFLRAISTSLYLSESLLLFI